MTKTFLTAAILALSPTLGFAMCTGAGHAETQTTACAEGTSFDAELQRCVPVISG